MIFHGKHTIAIGCTLMLCAATLATSLNTLPAGEREPEYFAGHRVLRFYRVGKYGGKRTISIDLTRVIFQDRAGVFWVGSSLGLYSYDERRDHWVNFREKEEQKFFKSVWVIRQDKAGRIWLKSLSSEFKFFDGQSWHSAKELAPPVALPENSSVMFAGKDHKLWFVTDGGLITFDGKEWTPPVMPPKDIERTYTQLSIRSRDLDEQEVEGSSARVAKELVLGQEQNPENEIPKTKRGDLLLPNIYQGLQARDGTIWLGASKAIVRFEEKGNVWKVYPLPKGLVEVGLIYEDRQGRLWFADWEGHLSVYYKRRDHWQSYELSTYFPQIQPKAIECIYQDKAGQVMIGTGNDGLILFNEKENRWRILHEENSNPPVYSVTAISEDNKGRIWIGMSEGILVLEQ